MKKTAIILAAAMLFLFVAAMAEDQKPAGEEAMMMGTPPEMKQVDFMIGIWDVDMQFRMSPEAQWGEANAVNTNDFILDGCVLESTFEGDLGGAPLKGLSLITYSRSLGKWQTMWTDNMGYGMSLYTGDFTGGKMVFAGGDVMPDGANVLSRMTFYNITDTKYDWMMENSTDDGQTWYTSMKATYTKRQ